MYDTSIPLIIISEKKEIIANAKIYSPYPSIPKKYVQIEIEINLKRVKPTEPMKLTVKPLPIIDEKLFNIREDILAGYPSQSLCR